MSMGIHQTGQDDGILCINCFYGKTVRHGYFSGWTDFHDTAFPDEDAGIGDRRLTRHHGNGRATLDDEFNGFFRGWARVEIRIVGFHGQSFSKYLDMGHIS